MTDQARRDVLKAGAAIAVSSAISANAWTRSALAQRAISSEWDYRTVGELVEALQARRISASELVEHTIARIEALDQRLNAVVVRDFKRARETAKAADVALARGERRPLLGVPITIKESFNITGLPTTYGVPRFKDFVPKEDAVLVSRVKSAGAVILGKTNVPLLLNDLLPGTSAARLEGHRAGLPQHSPPVLDLYRWLGYRWVAARAGTLLRYLRSQANHWACARSRPLAAATPGLAARKRSYRGRSDG
jgi:hypothetical protein